MTDQEWERLKQICALRGIELPSKRPEPYKPIDPNIVENAYRESVRFGNRTALFSAGAAAIMALPLYLLGANTFVIQAAIYATGGLMGWIQIRRFKERHP